MHSDDYLVSEKPLRALIGFSFPMLIGNLFQQFYTMADSIIVGRFIGENALASVGASYALTTVFIAIAIGGGAGASVITSRAFGAASYRTVKESITTALISFLLISAVLAFAGYMLSPRIMLALSTPSSIMEDAVAYLRIYFLGLPFLFLYNILSSVFNSLGRSRIPLFLLVFSSLLNIVLDAAAVAVLGMGVEGAAWATLVSQAVSAVLSYAILIRVIGRMESGRTKPFSPILLREMAGIAIPSIIQQATISIGMMLVQSVVNGFGPEILAGYSAAIRVDSIATVAISAIGNAMSPYTAQNIGAGKPGRIEEGLRASFLMVFASCAFTCMILMLFSHGITGLFLGADGSEAAYKTGDHYLSFLGWFYWILGLAMAIGGVLRGSGGMKYFTIASIANLSFRVISAIILAPRYGVEVVWHAVPAGWAIYLAICSAAYMMRRKLVIGKDWHSL